MPFVFFPLLLKYSACHEKVMPGHTVRSAAPCCTCHAESSWQTWRSDAPRCNLSQEISTRTSQHLWWTWLLYCACHGKCILADPLQTSRLPRLSKFLQNLHALLTFDKVQNPLRRPRETASEHPKVVGHVVLLTFWLGNVLRATTAYAFSTSHNFQKCSEAGVFCRFWLRNVLRATVASTFSTCQLTNVLRPWCALYILTVLSATTACTF